MKSTEMEFWDGRYRAGRMPWDFRGVPRALMDWLQRTGKTGRVLIPGCGSGYEVRAFAERGWDVVAVDFSPSAVSRAQTELGALGERVVLADFFGEDFGGAKFDVVYERTFLCSLPPDRWPEYARRVAESLVAGGKLLGFFFYGEEDEPPPFPLTAQQVELVLGKAFKLVSDEAVTDSLPMFAGRERWQVWKKVGGMGKRGA